MTKKRIIIPVIIIGLLAIGGVTAAVVNKRSASDDTAKIATATNVDDGAQNPENKVDYSAPTESEQQDQEAQKAKIVSGDKPADVNLAVTITRTNQSAQGQPVYIRTLVNGTTTGTCTLSLTMAGQPTITRTYPVAFEATTSSCQMDGIAANTFTADGTWTVTATVAANGSTSAATTSTVTVER